MGQGYKKKNTFIFCRLFSYFLLIEICMHQDYNNDDNGKKKASDKGLNYYTKGKYKSSDGTNVSA